MLYMNYFGFDAKGSKFGSERGQWALEHILIPASYILVSLFEIISLCFPGVKVEEEDMCVLVHTNK